MRTHRHAQSAQALTLTFLAEWGDRSQIATIILGARENPVGVCVGGVLGHAVCTFIAVMGGRIVAQRISIRTGLLISPGSCVLVWEFSTVYSFFFPLFSLPPTPSSSFS